MKALLIDDDPGRRARTLGLLRGTYENLEWVAIGSLQEFETALARADFDLVITEYRLAWGDGLQVTRSIKNRFHCIPVIMLTAYGDEDVAVAGMKAGLSDYIGKGNDRRLLEAVGNCLSEREKCFICQDEQRNVLLCEKWDLAISRLTSDYAYSLRIHPDGKVECEWVTEPFGRITGYPTREIACMNGWLAPIHAEDIPVFRRWFDRLLAGHQDVCEYRIIGNNGSVIWLRDHALPIRDWAQGTVVRIYGAAQEITSRRIAEIDARIKQRAIESSNNGIVITGLADIDYGIIYANSAFQRMTGYSMDELRGQNCRFLQGGDRAQAGLAVLHSALQSGCDGYSILRNYRKDGGMFWNEIYISPVRDDNGRITHYVGVQNDITDRKLAEAKLADASREIKDLYDHAPCGYHSLGPNGTFLRINATELDWLGRTAEEVLGRLKFKDILAPASQAVFLREFRGLKKTGHIEELELELVRRDGGTLPVLLSSAAIHDDQGKFRMCRSIVYDITDRKRAEDAVRELSSHLQSAREEERTRIAREIHDELGSLLATLKLDINWLAKRFPRQESELCNKTAEMTRLVDSAMLSVSTLASELRPSILDTLGILAAIEWQVQEFKAHTSLACKLSLPPVDSIDMDGDRATAVFRILQESLTNIARHAKASRVEVSVRVTEKELNMAVADDGIGMADDKSPPPSSWGLLGMVERARSFGGTLLISSKPNAGTMVKLNMPLHGNSMRPAQ
jgi:PAS domain S-box-containing protein